MKLGVMLGAPLTSHVYSRIEADITKKSQGKQSNQHTFFFTQRLRPFTEKIEFIHQLSFNTQPKKTLAHL